MKQYVYDLQRHPVIGKIVRIDVIVYLVDEAVGYSQVETRLLEPKTVTINQRKHWNTISPSFPTIRNFSGRLSKDYPGIKPCNGIIGQLEGRSKRMRDKGAFLYLVLQEMRGQTVRAVF